MVAFIHALHIDLLCLHKPIHIYNNMISLIRTIIGYSLVLIVIADEIPAVGNEGQREEGQEGGDSVDAEKSVATPSLQQQLITYGIGVVFGLIVGLVLLFYLCRSRRSGNEAKLPSTENYEKLATDDIERGMELSSRNSVGSSEVDSIEEKNWDDWEGDNETSGEFIQSSSYVSSSSAPSLQAHPDSVSPVSFRSSSSTGSLGKSNSKSISAGSKKKSSPKPSRRKTSTPVDDDVFAVRSYILQ